MPEMLVEVSRLSARSKSFVGARTLLGEHPDSEARAVLMAHRLADRMRDGSETVLVRIPAASGDVAELNRPLEVMPRDFAALPIVYRFVSGRAEWTGR